MKPVAYSDLATAPGRALDYLAALSCTSPEEWLHESSYVFRLSRNDDVRTIITAVGGFVSKDAHTLVRALRTASNGDPRMCDVIGRALCCSVLRPPPARAKSPAQALAIFGASTFGRHAFRHFSKQYTISCFFDNDSRKAGSMIDGVEVRLFHADLSPGTILVASSYAAEIVVQLLAAGVSPSDIVVIPTCDSAGFLRAEEDLLESSQGSTASRSSGLPESRVFDFDGLQTVHDFPGFRDENFSRAFDHAIRDSDHLRERLWPLHTALFCARNAVRLDGDFVECGVWFGFLTTGILTSLDWNASGKRFYLVDTFQGIDESILTDEERAEIPLEHYRSHYTDNYAAVVAKFKAWKNVHVIRGSVPAILGSVPVEKICYLSIDMNNASAEIGALRVLWPKVVSGGYVLLDDYGYVGHETQRAAFDAFFHGARRPVLALPTGQGLVIK